MGVQITPYIKERALYFICFNELADAIEPLQHIQRREIGMQCFLLNRFNLAALLSEEWQVPHYFPAQPLSSESFEHFKKILPPWIMIICLQGGPINPEKKIAYETDALRGICNQLNCTVLDSLPFGGGISQIILDEMLRPFRILKKFNYRGSVHDITFKSPIRQIANMESIIRKTCAAGGYDAASIGGYILPLERGRAIHCEFDLYADPADSRETQRVRQVWLQTSEALMRSGAFFDRPYGPWAEMVYQRTGIYTEKLKEIKKELDPNNILNPGKLCF
jgi:hypothetical protein